MPEVVVEVEALAAAVEEVALEAVAAAAVVVAVARVLEAQEVLRQADHRAVAGCLRIQAQCRGLRSVAIEWAVVATTHENMVLHDKLHLPDKLPACQVITSSIAMVVMGRA